MSIEQLITSGGAISILAAIVLAYFTGRVYNKNQVDERLAELNRLWTDRFADERTEKEAWKTQAQQLAPAVAKIADELEEANERDATWKAALAEGTVDRRTSP